MQCAPLLDMAEQSHEGEVADAARRAMADAVMDEAEGLGGLESEGEIWLPGRPGVARQLHLSEKKIAPFGVLLLCLVAAFFCFCMRQMCAHFSVYISNLDVHIFHPLAHTGEIRICVPFFLRLTNAAPSPRGAPLIHPYVHWLAGRWCIPDRQTVRSILSRVAGLTTPTPGWGSEVIEWFKRGGWCVEPNLQTENC